MTTTLTLRPLPGPTNGALVAAHLDPRPCVTNPIGWWDTGDPNNSYAITLCKTRCPLRQRTDCKPGRYEPTYGVIRAGVAYNHRGTALKQCPLCDQPMTKNYGNGNPRCGKCSVKNSQNPADHHQHIARLAAAKKPWSYIGTHLGIDPDVARSYWTEHIAKQRARVAGRTLVRLPGVTDDSRNKPADHADLVIRMLTDRDNAYTAEEVAWVIGSTLDAVKSFWTRERKRRLAAGENLPDRQWVGNAVRYVARRRPAAVNTCVTCELPEDRWDTTDRLYICGGSQCPGCSRADLDAEQALEHSEMAA